MHFSEITTKRLTGPGLLLSKMMTPLTLSIISGRLVAATTVTSLRLCTPSISVRSWASTLSPTLLLPEELNQ